MPEADGKEFLLERRRAHGDDSRIWFLNPARVIFFFIHGNDGKMLRFLHRDESFVVKGTNYVDAVVQMHRRAFRILIHVDDVIRVIDSKPEIRAKNRKVFFDICLQHAAKSFFLPL